jgi:hypothetical protein
VVCGNQHNPNDSNRNIPNNLQQIKHMSSRSHYFKPCSHPTWEEREDQNGSNNNSISSDANEWMQKSLHNVLT